MARKRSGRTRNEKIMIVVGILAGVTMVFGSLIQAMFQ
jgi:hypothetical protein